MNTKILACAEDALIGKTFKEGEIEFTVSERFYKGKKVSEKQLKELLHEIDNINLVGEQPVKIAIELNLIDEQNVLRVEKIPHVQIFRI
ncbi:MAG: DUF424 family protein [archaeon]|nr:DUF424 family protein [archaeon]